ncbi:hypothetical protein GOODEAATRI_024700 [Goodea atripinnis]|uniref:STAS domain-containing protein n=1 Tax=Goodea atripinnis TaxID=208336 RepID=A0ABV0PRD2_9TELE
MAFALLTSVAPIFGLYTSFFPVVMYMIFGTGRHVSTGTFAVVSLMTGSVVEQLVPTPLVFNSSSSEAADLEAQRIGVASAVALLSGIIMTLALVMENLSHTNMAELLISVVCLAVLVPVKEVNTRYRHRLRTPIPVEILMLPAFHTFPAIAGDTIAITFVGYAVSVSLAMIYADKHGYSIHPNQELLAHGISNTVSSFFTCFPSSATLATTNILESAGGYTQLSGLFTSLVVLIVLLVIGPLFYFLPKCYEVPGVKILTYNGPIYYGNRSFFREKMSRVLGLTPEKIRSREKAKKALEKREREASVSSVL